MRAAGLTLRFCEGSCSTEPPDLAAFSQSRADRDEALRQEIALLRGATPRATGAPLVVFFRHAEYPIPAPARVMSPDFGDWALRPVLSGYVAAVPRSGPRRSALWIIAACIPLALPVEAAAAPSKGKAPVQRPSPSKVVPAAPEVLSDDDGEEAGPPALPDGTPGAVDSDAAEGEDEGEGDEAEADDADAEDEDAGRSPRAEPPPPPPSPDPFGGSGRTHAQATLDAAWEGVDGRPVAIRLEGGKTMTGVVGAVQPETFTLIESETGVVLVLPKSGVASLRVAIPPPIPKQSGTGFLVGGGVLTAMGTPTLITGVVFLAVCPSCVGLNVSLLLFGGAGLGAGIPLLVRGVAKRRAYRDAIEKRQLVPVISRTSNTWTGGIRFRF